jgi:hypothetical protein
MTALNEQRIATMRIGSTTALANVPWVETAGERDKAKAKATIKEQAKKWKTNFVFVHESKDGRRAIGRIPGNAKRAVESAPSLASWLASVCTMHTIIIHAIDDVDYYVLEIVGQGDFNRLTDRILSERDAIKLAESLLNDADRALQTQQEPFEVVLSGEILFTSNMLKRVERNTRRESLADLLAGKTPPSSALPRQVQGWTKTAKWATAAGLFAIVAVIASIVWGIQEERVKRQAEDLRKQQAQAMFEAELPNLRAARIYEVVKTSLATATSTPAPSDVLRRCLDAYALIGTFQAGWQTSAIDCDGTNPNITVGFRRGPDSVGTNVSITAWAEQTLGQQPTLDTTGLNATVFVNRPLPQARPPMLLKDLPANNRVSLELVTRMQTLQIAVGDVAAMVAPAVNVPLVYRDPEKEQTSPATGDVTSPVPPEQGYMSGTWTWSGSDISLTTAVDLDWNWLSMTKMTINFDQNGSPSWRLEGNYYAR